MFMSDDRKKRATLIVDGMRNSLKEMPKDVNGDEIDAKDALEAAAQDIMSALESKNPAALVEALKSFMEVCEVAEGESEETY